MIRGMPKPSATDPKTKLFGGRSAHLRVMAREDVKYEVEYAKARKKEVLLQKAESKRTEPMSISFAISRKRNMF